MNLGQLGADVVVLVIIALTLLVGGASTPETSAPADDIDRSIDADVTEPDADDAPPEDFDLGTKQEPVVADDDGTNGSGDDGAANESGNEDGTFGTVETGDDDTDSPTRTTKPCSSPVGVSDYDDGDSNDGSSDDSFSDNSTDDSSTNNSIDDASLDGSTDNIGDDAGDDSGGGLSGGDPGDDIGVYAA